MNKFSWYEAKSVEDALQQVSSTIAEEMYQPSTQAAVFKSGGVDLLDLVKEGLVRPQKIVNIRNIPGLDRISYDPKAGLRIGANVTLAELEASREIKDHFRALHEAVAHAATPQLRNMSTLAGNLAQRTRCWYFRSIDHQCFRKGGDRCFARSATSGENENHAILENGSCVSVHASSIATALMAFRAGVVIVNGKGEKREVLLDDFFVAPGQDAFRENVLAPKELITEIVVPAPAPATRSFYIKQVARESYDWSLGDVAVVAEVSGRTCRKASIVLGAAAPVPYRALAAEKAMEGKAIDEKNATAAAEAAMDAARPLSRNGYKVPLFLSIIRDAILGVA